MKTQMTETNRFKLRSAAGLLLALCLATPNFAGPGPAPGHSSAFGKTLAGWDDTYFRWYIGELSIPTDSNGNAAVNNIVLMPLPNVPGDGTPGHLDVTLKPGQGFVLPLFFLLGTSYTDGVTPPDPLVDPAFFSTLNLTLKIDGVTVINGINLTDYFEEFLFAPPIPIDAFGIDSVIWCESVSAVHSPLSVGAHSIELDIIGTQALPPNFGGYVPVYHNTWSVTVKP
jgi:hypothetical protein